MGEMISNLAHQWRQPLNTPAPNLPELPVYYKRRQFSKEYLAAIVTKAMREISHMSKTIDNFRNFFNPDEKRSPSR